MDQATAICKVAEMYSPPRITAEAKRSTGLNISGGTAFDLSVDDEHGVPWDFRKLECRQRARKRIDTEKPYVLIGTPPCVDWSSLNQGFNHPKMEPT